MQADSFAFLNRFCEWSNLVALRVLKGVIQLLWRWRDPATTTRLWPRIAALVHRREPRWYTLIMLWRRLDRRLSAEYYKLLDLSEKKSIYYKFKVLTRNSSNTENMTLFSIVSLKNYYFLVTFWPVLIHECVICMDVCIHANVSTIIICLCKSLNI